MHVFSLERCYVHFLSDYSFSSFNKWNERRHAMANEWAVMKEKENLRSLQFLSARAAVKVQAASWQHANIIVKDWF